MALSWGKRLSLGLPLLSFLWHGVLWALGGGDLGLADDALNRGVIGCGNCETHQVLWGGPRCEGPCVEGKFWVDPCEVPLCSHQSHHNSEHFTGGKLSLTMRPLSLYSLWFERWKLKIQSHFVSGTLEASGIFFTDIL